MANFSILPILAWFINTWKVAFFRVEDKGESPSTKTAGGGGGERWSSGLFSIVYYLTAPSLFSSTLTDSMVQAKTLLVQKLRLIDEYLCCKSCSYDHIFP